MKFGNSDIYVVSDGNFKMDGGSIFGIVPKTIWANKISPDDDNCINVALNCILIKHAGKSVLIDTGIGNKLSPSLQKRFSSQSGKLLSNLKELNVAPSDIDYVIITHLHFDHVGGCTAHDNSGNLYNVFPNATHFIQKRDWDEATILNDRTKGAYNEDDFIPLYDNNQLELIDGDFELIPGLNIYLTGGHTAGHQIITLASEGRTFATLGDILPTEHHLPTNYLTSFDINPLDSISAKSHWIPIAESEQWLVSFGHSENTSLGFITRDDRDRMCIVPFTGEL
tara:strand:- start:4898 stop:5743 length:846 start_codon:yes stop_codon:yes gene_type:complete